MAEPLTPRPTPATVAAQQQEFDGVTPESIRRDVAEYLSETVEHADDTTAVVGLFTAAHDTLSHALDSVEDELD